MAAASPPVVEGRGRPDVTVPRVEPAAVVVDGRLDEPAWAQAVRLTGFWQLEPVDGRPAAERTEVLVWYSPDAIHFGILAYDRDPRSIRATNADRDAIDGEDHVVIYLDTFNDRRRAYVFAVNPLGVQQDGVRTEGAASAGRMFGGETDLSPDFLFESSGRVTSEGYVVEVRIPFKSLRFSGAEEQTWGLNIERNVQRTGYRDTWTDVRRASASFLIQSGTIRLRGLERGIVFEAQPFLTASAPGSRDPVSGAFRRGEPDTDAGLNLRVGLTGLTLDATVNPDFSQVETDEGQVTVNERFALFFPEKRPFFLEGIELFNTPGQLIYTRQIVDPVAGAKVTGKLGGLAVAHLTAVDEDVDAAGREALFNVTRLRHDFGASSLVGLTFTDRSLSGARDYNRVLAADTRIVFGRLYFVEAQLGGSWTREGAGPARSAPIWELTFDRTGRAWGFNYQVTGLGEDFEARAGFVPRTGIVNAHAFNRFSWYGAPGARVETGSVLVRMERLWRYGAIGDGAIEGDAALSLSLRLRGGWSAEVSAGRGFVELDAADYAGYETETVAGPQPYTPLDRVAGPQLDLEISTPTFRRFDASLSASRGRTAIFPEGSAGTGFAIDGSLSVRPTPWARLTASTQFERITRERDGSEFARTLIPRIKLEVQPTRPLFFRAVAEYRSERSAALEDARTGAPLRVDGELAGRADLDALRVDLLASYEPAPGTAVYLGYGSSLERSPLIGPARLERTTDGFFLKVAYRFRR
ncbi:MAG TPA: DUF5916 domain-containing protein [Longimicrobiales bacterium]